MILTKQIPINADDFIRRCATDCRLGRYARDGDYLEFLIAETSRSHPKLLNYLRVVDREPGKPRFYAQADHIVPQAVWTLLMPSDLHGPGRPDGCFMHSLSNLFWRAPMENQAYDLDSIRHIRDQAYNIARQGARRRREWANHWIEIFLLTKRDEALVFSGDLVNLSSIEHMPERGTGTNWMGGN